MIKKRFDSALSGEEFKALLNKHRVKRIAVFGSYAYGEPTQKSDIDFLVEFKKGADLLDHVGLKQDLEEYLKKKVDVVTKDSLSKYLRAQVLKKAQYLNV